MISYHTCPLETLGGKDTGGMNVYVRELTRHLGQLGVQVDVFTRSSDEHVPHILHDLGYGNRVVHIPAGPEVPLPKAELETYIPAFSQRILSLTQQKGLRYDLIHSHYWMSGLSARDLKTAWNVPIIHMFHTLGVMKRRVARLPGEKETDSRLKGEQDVLKLADCLVAATQAEYAQLQWLYQAEMRKVSIVPPGVDLSRFYPIPSDEAKEVIGIPSEARMLLFVGRIEPLKGLDTLIEAFAEMHRREALNDKPLTLFIIGGDPDVSQDEMTSEMARIQELCKQFGVEEHVTFLGKRPQDSLPYYYSAAEAVVVPSQYESFGMVALEAMACGTPVVASQVGGLAFLVQDGETGFTVPVGEPWALADRLSALISDPELRQRMGARAAQLARQYGWVNIAERITRLYQGLVPASS